MEEFAAHPLDYVSVLRRRKWYLIVPIALSIVAGTLLAALWPREYVSEAQIGIAAPTLSPELLKGVSSLDREQRQLAISQQLLSRSVIERVVRDEQLDPGKSVDEIAAKLRARVVVTVDQPIGRGESRNGLDSFKLGYTDASPSRAQTVTNRLASVFVEENSKTQTERAENTSGVFGEQLQASQQRLTQLEAALRSKKEANMGRLPDQVGANLSMANGLRQSLDSYSMQLRTEQDRLSQLEIQIDQMRQGANTAPVTADPSPAAQAAQTRVTQLQQELAQVRALGYTDKHPEVDRLKSEIGQAQTQLASIRQPAGASREELLLADPIYRQRVADREAARLRVRALQAQAQQASAQIGQYQGRAEAAPMVEQDLAAVQRDVDLEKIRYTDLKTKHESARLAEELARKNGGERFSILYPAQPGRPSNPGQPARFLLMSIVLGVVLGAALVVGREFMDRSIHDARALQSEFEIPVLGEIPRIQGSR